MPSALILLAEGAEEIETVVVADILVRGKVNVTIASLTRADSVKCSRNVVIKPDVSLSEVDSSNFDILILPGGLKGAENLSKCNAVGELLKKFEQQNKYIACICAAPTVLATHKIATGNKVTSYPSFEKQLTESGYVYSEDLVVVDNKLITSRGPGTSFEFALTILEKLIDKQCRNSVQQQLLLK
ncbi:hypothetical protein HELRODRAFT_156251 [Helobdella robusta]|uniref:DJ-1/PfpI domain-containing protein n=1 Tax=Helobdella robusta TaxID=6412 RepID=T1ELT4_HELRO|nr:hypothetical protein HELRODRAFT_156251 [Helobdella robusta]ESO11714.1 hypothetical protein HELRODRAFT_156251 [Helobdella robusta]